jgi:PIN domain nuclease of toxin-antitoxin system
MIHVLLDTNIVLWLAWDNPRVNQVKPMLLTQENKIFISVASWWEIATKVRSGKFKFDMKELFDYAQKHGFKELPLTSDCLKAYSELPNIHKDPFDHMLLAQALTYPMRLITGDSLLADYSSLVMVV